MLTHNKTTILRAFRLISIHYLTGISAVFSAHISNTSNLWFLNFLMNGTSWQLTGFMPLAGQRIVTKVKLVGIIPNDQQGQQCQELLFTTIPRLEKDSYS